MNQNQASSNLIPVHRTILETGALKQKIGAEFYEQSAIHLLKVCDEIALQKNIKFLSRYLYDMALTDLEEVTEVHKDKLWIVCITLAYEISEADNLEGNLGYTQLFQSWAHEQNLEPLTAQIRKIFNKKQNQSAGKRTFTPYNLMTLKLKSELIPSSKKQKIQNCLESIIDLAISHPDVSCYSCENIFEASYASLAMNKPTWINGNQEVDLTKMGERTMSMLAFLEEMISQDSN